jgi:predicted metalloendopeptidase
MKRIIRSTVVAVLAANVDAWYHAIAVKPGDMLYPRPERRVKIW